MDCNARIKQLLKSNGVRYEAQTHTVAYTAQRVAESEHISGWNLAKVVIGITDTRMIMFVVPTPLHLNLTKAARAAGVDEVSLASEAEFESVFPDCEAGAMPPFGGLYGLPTFVDSGLAQQDGLVFQAGSHTETIKVRTADYLRLSGAVVADLVASPGPEQHRSGLLTESPRR